MTEGMCSLNLLPPPAPLPVDVIWQRNCKHSRVLKNIYKLKRFKFVFNGDESRPMSRDVEGQRNRKCPKKGVKLCETYLKDCRKRITCYSNSDVIIAPTLELHCHSSLFSHRKSFHLNTLPLQERRRLSTSATPLFLWLRVFPHLCLSEISPALSLF